MKAKTHHKAHRTIQAAKLSLKKMLTDVKDPAAIIGGMVVGKLAGDLLDKAINKTSTVAGLRGIGSMSNFIKPVVLIGAGLAGKQMLKNPLLKNVGIGVAAYGGAIGVNNVVNIPQLSAFGTGVTTTTPPAATSGFGTIARRTLPATAAAARYAPPSGVIL